MRIVALVCLLAFSAGCSGVATGLPPEVSAEASLSVASDAVYLDVTKRGVEISRKNFDLVVESVCDRELPDRQAQSREWNRVADTIGELGGLESFLDARVVVSEIDDNICT